MQQQFAAALVLSESPDQSVEMLTSNEENQAALRTLRACIPQYASLGRQVAAQVAALVAERGPQAVDLTHGSEEPDSGGLPARRTVAVRARNGHMGPVRDAARTTQPPRQAWKPRRQHRARASRTDRSGILGTPPRRRTRVHRRRRRCRHTRP
jgi:hypothetical protein